MNDELLKKLRYKDGLSAAILHAPEGYGLGIESAVQGEESCDFVLLFVNNAAEVDERLTGTIALLKEDAVFWIAYPKQSSKVKSDVNRDILAGLVQDNTAYRPVSNVALDDKWSALRFREKDKVKSAK